MSKIPCTLHAQERYRQRVNRYGLADPSASIALPARRLAQRYRGRNARHVTYRVSACALWVIRGGRAVTCLSLSLADTASILVWAIFGQWPDDTLIDPDPDPMIGLE